MDHVLEPLSSSGLMGRASQPRKMSRARRAQQLVDNPLAYQLRSLGIQPLNKELVAAYKQKKLDELHYPVQPKRELKSYATTLITIALFSYLVGNSLPGFWMTTLAIVTGAAVSLIVWVITGPYHVHPQPQARWVSTEIGKFMTYDRRSVPEKALEQFKQIRARLPGAQAMVEWLYTDPLLHIYYANPDGKKVEDEYTYVWDEPELSS